MSKELIPLKGIQLGQLPFQFKKMGDLLYYEGPVLSHFINEKNEDFLAFWTDRSEDYNRWMFYRTPAETLLQFFEGKVGDLELIINNPDGFVYLADIDGEANWRRFFLVPIDIIPPEYLPENSAKYNPETFDEYAHNLHIYLRQYCARMGKLYSDYSIESAPQIAAEPPPPPYRKSS